MVWFAFIFSAEFPVWPSRLSRVADKERRFEVQTVLKWIVFVSVKSENVKWKLCDSKKYFINFRTKQNTIL